MGNSKTTIVRQSIVGAIYLTPFWLTFLYVPSPFNILAACLLIIKQKLPKDTDLYQLQAFAKQAAVILSRSGTDEDQENLGRMKKAFGLGDEALHDAEVEGASAKFLVDTLFTVAEAVSIVAMIGLFIFS